MIAGTAIVGTTLRRRRRTSVLPA
ncbi:MAG: hypothetical protein ACRYG4_11335 [Janthinobacterium lividum]